MTAKVLVVDDEPLIRLLYRVNLEWEGLEVIEAADGVEGLERAARDAPDVILLDVMMPRLDGWHVAEQLRADPVTRDIPFVFATPRSELRDRIKGLDLGAAGYIVLPLNPLLLAPYIKDLLARSPAEREALRRDDLAEVLAWAKLDGLINP